MLSSISLVGRLDSLALYLRSAFRTDHKPSAITFVMQISLDVERVG